jgi:hypothetical protein
MADEALEFQSALDGYSAFVTRDPGSRFAARAQARIEDLRAHSEGGFAPLVMLERVRRDDQTANSLVGITALDRAIERFPPGSVRAEAKLLVGEAYLNRLNRPRDAVRVLRSLAEDSAATQDMRSLAAERLIDASGMVGEERVAAQEIVTLRVDPEVKQNAVVHARRSVLRRGSWFLVATMAFATLVSVVTASMQQRLKSVLRTWLRPLPLIQLAMLTLGGGALGRLYDDHEMGPFYALAGGGVAVYLGASAWSVVGSQKISARIGRAMVCFFAALAVSFLAMDSIDPMMLEGINL